MSWHVPHTPRISCTLFLPIPRIASYISYAIHFILVSHLSSLFAPCALFDLFALCILCGQSIHFPICPLLLIHFMHFFLPSATKLRRLCFYRRLSVHKGVGWRCLPQCILGYHPPKADTPQEQTPPQEADTPPKKQTPPPRYGHCCGRYASYWNAFLF